MHHNKKQIVTAILLMCMCIIPFHPASAAGNVMPDYEVSYETNEGVMPRYNNVGYVDTQMNISSSGKMSINYSYRGFPSSTTKAEITTCIEKRTLGIFWNKVNIGQPDNQWVDTIANYMYSGTRTYQLSSSGTYRVTVTYKIYGTGGTADTITAELKDSY